MDTPYNWQPGWVQVAKSQLAAQARLVPSSVCEAAHGPARPGELCDQAKLLQEKIQTEQIFPIFIWFLTTEEYTQDS